MIKIEDIKMTMTFDSKGKPTVSFSIQFEDFKQMDKELTEIRNVFEALIKDESKKSSE